MEKSFEPIWTAIKLLIAVTIIFCTPILFTKGIVGNFGDIYDYVAPFRHFAASTLQTGVMPLWNPYIFAGSPFLASPQSALFYPGTLLFYFLPLSFAVNYFSILHLLFNALGMFLLLGSLNVSRSGSILGSFVWAFSFLMLSRLPAGHIIHLSGYSWTPYAILFFVRVLNLENYRKIDFTFLLIALLLEFFSGHIQIWLLTAIFLFFIWIWKMSSQWEWKTLQLSFALLIFFACLSLIQSLPTLVYILNSSRFNTKEILPAQSAYDFAASYSMPWNAFIGWIIPNFSGNPVLKNFFDPDHPSVYFETYALYIGLIPLFLALAGLCLAIKNRRFLIPSAVVLFLFLALGKNNPLYPWFWKLFSPLRVPARFYSLALIGLIFSAAYFWEHFIRPKDFKLKILIFFLIALDLFIYGRIFIWVDDPLAKIGKSSALEWLTEISSQNGSRIFTTADLPHQNKSMFFHLKNVNGYEAVLQRSLFDYFIQTQRGSAISTTGVDANQPEKKSFALTGAKYLVTTLPLHSSWIPRFTSGHLTIYENPKPLPEVLPIFSLIKVPDRAALFSLIDSPDFDPRKAMIQIDSQHSAPGNFTEQNTHVFILQRNPNLVTTHWLISKLSPFWIFRSESYYPGWQAWSVSGEKMTPVPSDGYFQAILVYPSKTNETIYWRFNPRDFFWGALITTLSLSLLILAMGWQFAKMTEQHCP